MISVPSKGRQRLIRKLKKSTSFNELLDSKKDLACDATTLVSAFKGLNPDILGKYLVIALVLELNTIDDYFSYILVIHITPLTLSRSQYYPCK